MSDDATKSIQAEEPTNTEVASEPATVTKSEDTTVNTEDTVKTEGGDVNMGDDAKPESDVKAETQKGDGANREVKEENEKKEVDILKTTARHDDSNPRNNNKFDPSLAPITDDPVKIPGQIRTQVR